MHGYLLDWNRSIVQRCRGFGRLGRCAPRYVRSRGCRLRECAAGILWLQVHRASSHHQAFHRLWVDLKLEECLVQIVHLLRLSVYL